MDGKGGAELAKSKAVQLGACTSCGLPVTETNRFARTSELIHPKCARARIELARSKNREWFAGSYALEAGLLKISTGYLRPSVRAKFA